MNSDVAEAILTASAAYNYPPEIQALCLLVRSQQALLIPDQNAINASGPNVAAA